ncbi:MAG: tubulin-like doman-containing protein [Oscillospiraceae bacterium]|jgi:hypothetical protein|nr:tubulin-like doman-containing protein [Oscillospiraceae bacterium]
MPLAPDKLKRIQKNMSTLDYWDGLGIVPRTLRDMTGDDRWLIVGLGGTGVNAMIKLRQKLRTRVDLVSLENHVGFLAIDTDGKELDKKVAEGRIFESEKCNLPSGGAAQAILNPTPQMIKWLDPQLKTYVKPDSFDDTGAGARRQFGRVLLTGSAAVDKLISAVNGHKTKLMGSQHGARLNLIVLAGIAGGTGSGTIIDATYIISQLIGRGHGASTAGKAYGFILLPNASSDKAPSNPEDVANGSKNGYAALKEIEYHMTITARGEYFKMQYPNLPVNQGDLFDACFLVDGEGNDVIHKEPRTMAAENVSNCILNMISAERAREGGAAHASLMSFFIDVGQKRETFLTQKSDAVMPRDSYYQYIATGYTEMAVPMDLLRIHAVKRVFGSMFLDFEKRSKVSDQETISFLDKFGCGSRKDMMDKIDAMEKITIHIRKKTAKADIENAAQEAWDKAVWPDFLAAMVSELQRFGPSHMVTLCENIERILGEMKADPKLNDLDTHRNQQASVWIEKLKKEAKRQKETYFEPFAAVLTAFKAELDLQESMLDSKSPASPFKTTYYWSPFYDKDRPNETPSAIERVDDQVAAVHKHIRDKFMALMTIENKAFWDLRSETGLFDAAGALRRFVAEEFANIPDRNMQDVIAMSFSHDKDARAMIKNDGSADDQESNELHRAAERIAKELNSRAKVLAKVSRVEEFNGDFNATFLVMPADSPKLNELVKQLLPQFTAFTSPSATSYSLFINYLTLPLYAFDWTLVGEKAYANAGETVGVHMDMATEDWRRFPNLINEKKWPSLGYGYAFAEEARLSAHVRSIMEEAKQRGLVYQSGTKDNEKYSLLLFADGRYILPANASPVLKRLAELLSKANQKLGEGPDGVCEGYYTEAAQLLFDNLQKEEGTPIEKEDILGKVITHHIDGNIEGCLKADYAITQSILPADVLLLHQTMPKASITKYAADGSTPPKGYHWELTGRFMRKMFKTCLSLQRTIAVWDALMKLVEEWNSAIEEEQTSGSRLDLFPTYYGAGFFSYNEEEEVWTYLAPDDSEEELLCPFDLKGWQKKCEYYYLVQKYLELDEEVFASWEERYEEFDRDARRAAAKQEVKLLETLKKEAEPMKAFAWKNTLKKAGAEAQVKPIYELYDSLIAKLDS